jgi:uncharacterized protein
MAMRDVGLTTLILVLLVILGAAGEYNYQRNKAKEERAASRTYEEYSDSDLAALIEAYQQEVEALESRYRAARDRGVETRSGGLIDEQIGQFERAQMAGASVRSIESEVARKEKVLRELQEEQSLRRSGTGLLKVHLRRLVSI